MTALRISGCAHAIRICPASAAANVSDPSRTAPPTAVSHAPVSSALRKRRSSASPAGIARTTYSSGKTWESQPTALSETSKCSAVAVVIGA